ncbi:MAG TPA: ABC transporter permease [Lacunisphaera sp.]|nr:ABC transporter permease [Lacunisphaera sp.]
MPPFVRNLFRFQESGLVLIILVLGAVLTLFSDPVRVPLFERAADGSRQRVFVTGPDGERAPAFVEKNKFLNVQTLAQLTKDTSFIAIMAVGMAIVIIAGGIDLSVGSIFALSAVTGALVLRHYGPAGAATGISPGMGVLFGSLACIGTGALVGLINGGLIVGLRVHPFIVTLATMSILRGIAFVRTGGQSIGEFSPELRGAVRYELGEGLNLVPALVTLVVLIAGGIFLARLITGRRVYAIGGNELAARFSGIRVERVKLVIYLLSGLTAGIAALLSLGYYGAATSGDAAGYELNVISAAVIGGASLNGGRGSALGVVLGALIMQMISSGIVILGIDQNYSQVIQGLVLLAAVGLDNIKTWLAKRRLTASKAS